jgi:ADP-ribose pyrophosphatase YjhB (NUDIX family)
MKLSAGILFMHEDEALLVHSTNSAWMKTWMPPKGQVEEGETAKEAAIRETEEEIGIRVSPAIISQSSFTVSYEDRKGKIYKRVVIFPVRLISKDFESNPGVTKVGDLQKEEVDQIQWMNSIEVERRALPRYTERIIKELSK